MVITISGCEFKKGDSCFVIRTFSDGYRIDTCKVHSVNEQYAYVTVINKQKQMLLYSFHDIGKYVHRYKTEAQKQIDKMKKGVR